MITPILLIMFIFQKGDWHIAYLCFYTTITKKEAMPKPEERKPKK